VLYRVTYVSEAVGTLGKSMLSVAQILGVSEPSNRRDHLTSGILFHEGRVLQVIEGARVDVDRLLMRLQADPRHTGLSILADRPVADRLFTDPMVHCRMEDGSRPLDIESLVEGEISVDVAEHLLAEYARDKTTGVEPRSGTFG